jgi:hypothetical protein
MSAATSDLLKMGLSFVVASTYLVGWLHLTPQWEFTRTAGRSVAVMIRTLLIYGGVWIIARYGMRFPANEISIVAALLLILLPSIPLPTHLEEPSGIASLLGGDRRGLLLCGLAGLCNNKRLGRTAHPGNPSCSCVTQTSKAMSGPPRQR